MSNQTYALVLKILCGIGILICLFFLWKPRVGLNYKIKSIRRGKRWREKIGINIRPTRYDYRFWRLMGIDENINILPDGEKRFRIYMIAGLCLCIFLLMWIWKM